MTVLFKPLYFYSICVLLGAGFGFGLIFTQNVPGTVTSIPSTPQSRNSQRHATMQTLADALTKYRTDHHGLPAPLPTSPTETCITGGADCTSANLVDLSYLVNSSYIETLPNDPIGGHTQFGSGYLISQDGPGGTLHISTIRAEGVDTMVLNQ
jgi:hypothetical protein